MSPQATDGRQAAPDSGPDVENVAYAAMLRRMFRAYVRRVGTGDPEDLTLALDLHRQLAEDIGGMVDGLREQGWSWEAIGTAAGITKQSAWERWGCR